MCNICTLRNIHTKNFCGKPYEPSAIPPPWELRSPEGDCVVGAVVAAFITSDSRDARKRTLDRGPDGQPESHAPVNGLCEKVVDSHHLLDFSTMLSVNKSVGGYESQVNRLPR